MSQRDHPSSGSSPALRQRAARFVTEVLAPAPVSALVVVLVAVHSARSPGEALRWGGLAVLFATLVPFAYIVRGVRRQRLTDHHVGRREQRPLPLLVGVGSVALLYGLLSYLGAPRELLALIAAMVTGLVVSLLVTLVWKISVHAGVVAGTVVVLVVIFGPVALLLSPLILLVGWARVELGDHTLAQVIAGALLGAVVATSVFSLLR